MGFFGFVLFRAFEEWGNLTLDYESAGIVLYCLNPSFQQLLLYILPPKRDFGQGAADQSEPRSGDAERIQTNSLR